MLDAFPVACAVAAIVAFAVAVVVVRRRWPLAVVLGAGWLAYGIVRREEIYSHVPEDWQWSLLAAVLCSTVLALAGVALQVFVRHR